MKLFIAEKPSLGRAIAESLGIVNKTRTHIECREGTVTWCFGHLLEQCEPEEYDESWKEWSNLPVLPSAFKLKVRKNVKEQLSAIGELLRKANHRLVVDFRVFVLRASVRVLPQLRR